MLLKLPTEHRMEVWRLLYVVACWRLEANPSHSWRARLRYPRLKPNLGPMLACKQFHKEIMEMIFSQTTVSIKKDDELRFRLKSLGDHVLRSVRTLSYDNPDGLQLQDDWTTMALDCPNLRSVEIVWRNSGLHAAQTSYIANLAFAIQFQGLPGASRPRFELILHGDVNAPRHVDCQERLENAFVSASDRFWLDFFRLPPALQRVEVRLKFGSNLRDEKLGGAKIDGSWMWKRVAVRTVESTKPWRANPENCELTLEWSSAEEVDGKGPKLKGIH